VSLKDARNRLKERYLDGLASRREALELLLAAIHDDLESASEALRYEAGLLSRSARDYGFHGVADVAGRVEVGVDGELDGLTRALLDVLDEAMKASAPTYPEVLGAHDLRQVFPQLVGRAEQRGTTVVVLWVGTTGDLAARIRKVLRDTDVVAELEVGLAIVLPGTGIEGGRTLMERLEATGRVRSLAPPGLARAGDSLDETLERLRAT
jgi:hypothetical protein